MDDAVGPGRAQRELGPEPQVQHERRAAQSRWCRVKLHNGAQDGTRNRACGFGTSKVTSRHGRLWLAVSDVCSGKDTDAGLPDTRVRVFLWSGRKWRLDGTVTGPLRSRPSR